MGPISGLLRAYNLVLIAYVIIAWVPRMPEPLQPVARGIRKVVDPLLKPLRRVMPPLRIGGAALDLSILVLFFATSILAAVFAARGL